MVYLPSRNDSTDRSQRTFAVLARMASTTGEGNREPIAKESVANEEFREGEYVIFEIPDTKPAIKLLRKIVRCISPSGSAIDDKIYALAPSPRRRPSSETVTGPRAKKAKFSKTEKKDGDSESYTYASEKNIRFARLAYELGERVQINLASQHLLGAQIVAIDYSNEHERVLYHAHFEDNRGSLWLSALEMMLEPYYGADKEDLYD